VRYIGVRKIAGRRVHCLALMGAGVLGAIALVGCGSTAVSPTHPRGLAACTSGRGTFISASSLGSFKELVNATMSHPPYHGINALHPPTFPAYTEYVGGHQVGFVIDKVYQAPYWQQNLLLQAKYGSPSAYGKVPLVPLQGQIVTDTPGLLEAYEFISQYSSTSGASNYASNSEYSIMHGAVIDYRAISLSGLPPGTWAGEFKDGVPTPGNAGPFEHILDVEVVDHNFEVSFSFHGGNAIPLAQVDSIVSGVVQSLNRSCNLTSP